MELICLFRNHKLASILLRILLVLIPPFLLHITIATVNEEKGGEDGEEGEGIQTEEEKGRIEMEKKEMNVLKKISLIGLLSE